MKNNHLSLLLIIAAAFFGPSRTSLAQTCACDALPADKKALANEILSALHPYDGCDETFARCLEAKPPKPVVLRLAADICRQVKAGKDRKQIEHALSKRAQTMLPTGPRAALTLDEAFRAGATNAPVTVVVYACTRCPFCKVLVPALYAAVTDGPLAGKFRLYMRPFPLKSHPGSTEGGLALLSAAKLGRFWPFALLVYKRFDSFSPAALPEWAVAAGIDRAAFERAFADPKTRDELIACKQEGLRNKVTATPGIFIDGRPYLYDMNMEALLDVLEEAYVAAVAARR
ncbi:MAG TPA: thioredoxin domain-containing protein [Polyangia bacterium]|nr:thioredoxin domain-containing protein [Polyangia bacterium]